jgi:hypothetical protein
VKGWEAGGKFAAMEEVVRAKFDQNADLARRLLATEGSLLVEGKHLAGPELGVMPLRRALRQSRDERARRHPDGCPVAAGSDVRPAVRQSEHHGPSGLRHGRRPAAGHLPGTHPHCAGTGGAGWEGELVAVEVATVEATGASTCRSRCNGSRDGGRCIQESHRSAPVRSGYASPCIRSGQRGRSIRPTGHGRSISSAGRSRCRPDSMGLDIVFRAELAAAAVGLGWIVKEGHE